MSANLTLEQFVNSIRNLYGSSQLASQGSQQQPPQQQQGSSDASLPLQKSTQSVNYGEVLSTINSNMDALTENASNLVDNVLPVFVLPEYTLPNMAVLYAVIQHQQQSQAANTVNQEKLLNEIENCIKLADERQVDLTVFIISYLTSISL